MAGATHALLCDPFIHYFYANMYCIVCIVFCMSCEGIQYCESRCNYVLMAGWVHVVWVCVCASVCMCWCVCVWVCIVILQLDLIPLVSKLVGKWIANSSQELSTDSRASLHCWPHAYDCCESIQSTKPLKHSHTQQHYLPLQPSLPLKNYW